MTPDELKKIADAAGRKAEVAAITEAAMRGEITDFRDSLRRLWTPGMPDSDIVRSPDTLSVHIFGYTKRFLTTHHGSLPPPGSWLARRARAHGIDPAAAPALAEPLG